MSTPFFINLYATEGVLAETIFPDQVAMSRDGITLIDKTGIRSFTSNSSLKEWKDCSHPYREYAVLDIITIV